jgi:hypothetical protein
MNYYIRHIKDIFSNNYLGVEIQQETVNPFLNQLKEVLGDKYEKFTNNQKTRDNGNYHITLLNVMEYNTLMEKMGVDNFVNNLDKILKFPIDDIKLMGVGTAQRNENRSYFVVVESDKLKMVRETLGLDPKDFHITLGFEPRDVHGVRKNEIMKVGSSFISNLKKMYEKEGETFEFIKGIKNFDSDFYKQIETIKINDTNAIFRIGEDYLQVSMVEGELYITAKWQEKERLPILSDTIIQKKLNQK